jgi:hypothetical protein
MAIDRAAARRRVRTITAWAAGGAAALTAGLAFGASRGDHAAKSVTPAASSNNATVPQAPGGYAPAPDQSAAPQQGFAPPSASQSPPSGMSGGS